MAVIFNPHEVASFLSHVDAQPNGWFNTAATTTDTSSLPEDVKNVLSLVDQPIFPRNKTAWSAKRALAVHLYQELHRVAGVPHDKQDDRRKVANRIANVVNHLGRSCWDRYLEWMKIQNINHQEVKIDPTIKCCLESFPGERVFLPFRQRDGTLARVPCMDEASSVYKLKITHESRQKEFQVHRLEELRTVSADDDDHQIKLRSLELQAEDKKHARSEETQVKKHAQSLEDKRSERTEETQRRKLELEAEERAAERALAAEERAAERAAQERAAERAAQERAAERAERAAERDHEFRMLQATPSSNVSSHARTVARPANPSSATPPTAPSTAPPTTTSARNAGSGLGAVQKQLFTGLETVEEMEQQAAVAAQPSSTRASSQPLGEALEEEEETSAEDGNEAAAKRASTRASSHSTLGEGEPQGCSSFCQTHGISSYERALQDVEEWVAVAKSKRRTMAVVSAPVGLGELSSEQITKVFGKCSAAMANHKKRYLTMKGRSGLTNSMSNASERDYTCICNKAKILRSICLNLGPGKEKNESEPSKTRTGKEKNESEPGKTRNLFFVQHFYHVLHADGSEVAFPARDTNGALQVVYID